MTLPKVENSTNLDDLRLALEEANNEIESLKNELALAKIQPIIDHKLIFLAVSPFTGNIYTANDAFVLCAKDRAVPAALVEYISECKKLEADANQIKSAELLLERVLTYQQCHKTKVPDVSTAREIYSCTTQSVRDNTDLIALLRAATKNNEE